MEVTTEIEVRSTEIDVLGHVNNAKYLEYMEWGREEWYEKNDLPIDVFFEMGVGTVTVNININYRKEVKQGETLTIKTRPIKRGRSSYVMKQEILNQAGEVVSDAETTCVTMDMKQRKSAPLPAKLAEAIPETAE